jgi:hypothetical protein
MGAPSIRRAPRYPTISVQSQPSRSIPARRRRGVMPRLETLIDRAFKIETQLQELLEGVSEPGRREGIREIVTGYHAANKRAESVLRSIDG